MSKRRRTKEDAVSRQFRLFDRHLAEEEKVLLSLRGRTVGDEFHRRHGASLERRYAFRNARGEVVRAKSHVEDVVAWNGRHG